MLFLDKLEQNNASKQKIGHWDKTTLQIVSFLQFWLLIFHWSATPKFSQKYPVVLEKKFILLFLLFLVTAAILDIRPNPILQFFWDPSGQVS